MATPDTLRICFVCMGNICRSPMAEGVFRHLVDEAGLTSAFTIDSAGTGGWHAGDAPDRRMQRTAEAHGIDISQQQARQFTAADFERFDLVLVMDKDNLHDILYLDPNDEHRHKVRLFREFDPEPDTYQVPDPYYGGRGGFENVYQIVNRTSAALLAHLRTHLPTEPNA
ncbi:MAG: low molecular weight protein-tyrosine-phosphatase [Rhodothermales bacterium]